MNVLIKIIAVLAFSLLSFSKEITINNESFSDALGARTKIFFEMESTKAGFITTSFTGVVKKGAITFEESVNTYSNILVKFKVKDLDTDVDARNDKMYNLCFESEKYPEIEVSFDLIPAVGNQAVGVIRLRGESFPISINYSIDKNILKFDSKLSLKDLKIPDPSIFIAKVKDTIKLNGEIVLE